MAVKYQADALRELAAAKYQADGLRELAAAKFAAPQPLRQNESRGTAWSRDSWHPGACLRLVDPSSRDELYGGQVRVHVHTVLHQMSQDDAALRELQ